ncbi:MAG: hypothetical protein EPO24_08845 [Bacteroidetes bacterium]|nr:MAG: hypothetical protein EPO24_08845 [Bacteroidota bacterium]
MHPYFSSISPEAIGKKLYRCCFVLLVIAVTTPLVAQKPVISSFTPDTGYVGTPVQIAGEYFIDVSRVSFSRGNRDTIPVTLDRSLSGHALYVNSAKFSPSGQYIASGGSDKNVILWNVSADSIIYTLTGHTGVVYAVAWSPDGEYVASSGYGEIKIWNASDGSLVRTITKSSCVFRCLTYGPDGNSIATGTSLNTVIVYSVTDGSEITTLTGHTGTVSSVAYSPDSQYLASGSWDRTVRIWRASDWNWVRTLTGHTNAIGGIAYSPDGQRIASSGNDWSVRLWEAQTGTLLYTLTGHSANAPAVAYSPDNKYVISASDDLTMKIWKTSDGSLVRTVTGLPSNTPTVAFSPDGNTLASSSWDNTIKIWQWDGDIPATYEVSSSTTVRATAPEGFGDGPIRIQNNYGFTFSSADFIRNTNQPPIAHEQFVALPEDSSLLITLTGSDPEDSSSIFFEVLETTIYGELNGTPPALTYTPQENYYGADSLVFRVSDDELFDTAIVHITVAPVNDAPQAIAQTVTTDEDTPLDIMLTATDVDSATMTFVMLDSAHHGTITGSLPEIHYTPDANYYGNDSLIFQATDGELFDTATVQIGVLPVSDSLAQPPSLVYPEKNQILVPLALAFLWNVSSGAESYVFQLSTDSLFETITVQDTLASETTYTVSGLSYETTHFWRVEARNIDGVGVFSEVSNFKTVGAPPEIPTLLSPSNEAVGVLLPLTFYWNEAPHAETYHLQVSADSGFTLLVVDDSTLQQDSLTSSVFEHLTKYFWRLRAINEYAGSNWSQTWSFTTEQYNISLNLNGEWNLISIPVEMENNALVNLFSTADSKAFAYENGYIRKDTLSLGRGYWLRFNNAQQVTLFGEQVSLIEVEVTGGWNLIGSLTSPVDVATVTTVPPEMAISQFFEFAGGSYVQADTLVPGKGYWVKVNQNGKLVFSSTHK